MIRWEHRVVHMIHEDYVQDEIHKLEVLGWELVSATGFERRGSYRDHRSYTLFFKRQAGED